jgi:hypothetical protein
MERPLPPEVPPGLAELLGELAPGAKVVAARRLGPDDSAGAATAKGTGYGEPIRITLDEPDGRRRQLVLHTAKPDVFGHDRRADRAAELLLAFDTFGGVPGHVRALDVGAIGPGGRLRSLRDAGEFYLLTEWAPGTVYAEDLRRVAERGEATAADEERAVALGAWLVGLHRGRRGQEPADRAANLYARAIRDLVGHGEGIFGLVDAFPDGTPAAPRARLYAIERRAVAWREKLHARWDRLARTHGDFHPFNVVFEEGARFALLDASRGGVGDPADDVTCMAINFPFFALERPASWPRGLGRLHRRFLDAYLDGGGDREVLDVAPPFYAWRALVLANPSFYPSLPAAARERLLGLAERVLEAGRLDPGFVEELFQ